MMKCAGGASLKWQWRDNASGDFGRNPLVLARICVISVAGSDLRVHYP